MVRQRCGQQELDMKRMICRRCGQTDEVQTWVQDVEMGRMSLSAMLMCRWLPLDRKKRSRVRKHVDPEESRESTESKPLFLIWFKPRGRQRAASTNFPWTGASAEWASPIYLQIPNTEFVPIRPPCSSTQRSRKDTWTSSTTQSCSRPATVTERLQPTEHHSNVFPGTSP